METEKQVTKEILFTLREHGAFVFKHWSGPMSRKGVSDILGCLPNGQMVAIECKRKGGKPSKEQIEFIADIKRVGGMAFIADSVETVRTALKGQGIKPMQQSLFS